MERKRLRSEDSAMETTFKPSRSNFGDFGRFHDPTTAVHHSTSAHTALDRMGATDATQFEHIYHDPPVPDTESQSLGWLYRAAANRYLQGEPTRFDMALKEPVAVIHFNEEEMRMRQERGMIVTETMIWNVIHTVCGPHNVLRLLPGVYRFRNVENLVGGFDAMSQHLPYTRPDAQICSPMATVVWVDTMLHCSMPVGHSNF